MMAELGIRDEKFIVAIVVMFCILNANIKRINPREKHSVVMRHCF